MAILIALLFAIGSLWLLSLPFAERRCAAAGGKWRGPLIGCMAIRTECRCGTRRLPVGTVFWDGCNTCECLPHSLRCTAKACIKRQSLDHSPGRMLVCYDGIPTI